MDPLAHADGCLALEKVQNVSVFVNYLNDVSSVEGAGVEGLTTRGRVETGAIEPNRQAISSAFHGDNRGVELAAIGIVVIQPVRHWRFS
jgi:hypothetical protein